MKLKKMLLPVCALLLSAALSVPAAALSVSARGAVLLDAESGRVLYSKDCDQKMLIASTTKIMTALVALGCKKLTDRVTVKKAYTLTEGSSMYLKEGETLTLEALLYGLLLQSGNDAALAVADFCGGGTANFVKKMNEKAAELGMANTHFENPSGLDGKEHYSTAADMAKLAAAAMEDQTIARIASTRSISIGGRTMTNHNKLLRTYAGAMGLKTGYTKAAGRSLVSCAVRDGRRLVAVTLDDPNDWADHAALFDYGFSHFQRRVLNGTTEELYRIPVAGGMADSVGIRAETAVAYPVAADETVKTEVKLAPSVLAGVREGSLAGKLSYYIGGRLVGETYLLYAQTVNKVPVRLTPLDRVKNFFGIAVETLGLAR